MRRRARTAAADLGLARGGWAPRGYRAEDGTVPVPYRDGVREAPSPDYRQRTRLNVQDSDGTVIFTFGPLTGGSRCTRAVADQQRKPCLHIQVTVGVLPEPEAIARFRSWLRVYGIKTPNVAGKREGVAEGMQAAVRSFLVAALVGAADEPNR